MAYTREKYGTTGNIWIESCDCGRRHKVYIDQRRLTLSDRNEFGPIDVWGNWTCACGEVHNVRP